MTSSILTVTTPASSLALLTSAEMRAAVGLAASDQSQDSQLEALEARVAAAIMSECNIAPAAGKPPTLHQETLTETFYQVQRDNLVLSRKFDIELTSVVQDGQTIDAAVLLVDPESGFLNKLDQDCPVCWGARKVVVVYTAGFATIPGDLKQAAIDCFRAFWNEGQRDPFVKSEEIDIPDVERTRRDYWVGSIPGQSNEGAVPDIVAGQLKRFRNMAVA